MKQRFATPRMFAAILTLSLGLAAGSGFAAPRHDDRGNPPQHQPAASTSVQHRPTSTPTPPQRQKVAPQPLQRHPVASPSQQHRKQSVAYRFEDRQRGLAHSYYTREFSGRGCPPGLSRKGHNCVPTHATRAWSRGRPLPSSVVYYNLPPALVVELGPPPAGHRYVRVAGDILMIAVGTGLVVDALQDIFH
ncbi:hypothetical protein AGMMS50256_12290 [Betaproteobacteria bacterium]|nr:hypothetical protein AGMMS50256_12290 [Betaproteobacteria bacterium]